MQLVQVVLRPAAAVAVRIPGRGPGVRAPRERAAPVSSKRPCWTLDAVLLFKRPAWPVYLFRILTTSRSNSKLLTFRRLTPGSPGTLRVRYRVCVSAESLLIGMVCKAVVSTDSKNRIRVIKGISKRSPCRPH